MLTIRRIFLSPLLPRYRYLPTDAVAITSRIFGYVMPISVAGLLTLISVLEVVKFASNGVLLGVVISVLTSMLCASLAIGVVVLAVHDARHTRKHIAALTTAVLTGGSTNECGVCSECGVRSGSGVN